jgi:Uma2 family endonuclease
MLMTPEEFLTYPLEDVKAELVRGELRVTPPPGGPHGRATANLAFALSVHVNARRLGFVFGDGVGFELVQLPRTVRVPSPSESASEIQEKLDDYRVSGTPLVWVVDPVKRSVAVYASSAPTQWLHESDALHGGDVIPGFSCRVSDVFEGIARDLVS